MVRIVVTPNWAKLIDFEATLPSAVEELVRQREERQRGGAARGRWPFGALLAAAALGAVLVTMVAPIVTVLFLVTTVVSVFGAGDVAAVVILTDDEGAGDPRRQP